MNTSTRKLILIMVLTLCCILSEALYQLVGSNSFTLIAEDVTPAPFNQPPYPPAVDTDRDTFTVTGIAP